MAQQLGAHEACCRCAGVDALDHALGPHAMLQCTRDKAGQVGILQHWTASSANHSTHVVEAPSFGHIAALLTLLLLLQSSFEPTCRWQQWLCL